MYKTKKYKLRKDFNQALDAICDENGITIAEFADSVGIDKALISRWNKGTVTEVKEDVLERICDKYKIWKGSIVYTVDK
jgi:DNA-binding Xre family transcriptional regulator